MFPCRSMELTFLLFPVGHVSVFRDVVDQSVCKALPPALDILSHNSGSQNSIELHWKVRNLPASQSYLPSVWEKASELVGPPVPLGGFLGEPQWHRCKCVVNSLN